MAKQQWIWHVVVSWRRDSMLREESCVVKAYTEKQACFIGKRRVLLNMGIAKDKVIYVMSQYSAKAVKLLPKKREESKLQLQLNFEGGGK